MSEDEKQNRRDELLAISDDAVIRKMIEKMVLLEDRMEELEKLPWIRVNPVNPAMQKHTPAFFQFHRTLSSYKEIVKFVCKATGTMETDEESPLRSFIRQMMEESES